MAATLSPNNAPPGYVPIRYCQHCNMVMGYYRMRSNVYYICGCCNITKVMDHCIVVAPTIATETSHPGIVPAEIEGE